MARTEVLVQNRLTGEVREAWLDEDLDQVVNDRNEEYDYLKWSVIEDESGKFVVGLGVLAILIFLLILFALGAVRHG